uniref:Uncharacterized protein n=1 Tax=Amphimedon queenslandica TaxID=400682 RepID=A0A1X7TCJ6_AMPQE
NKKLYEAAGEGNINSVQSLLSQGANVTYQDQDHWNEDTPLHIAALRGHNEVVSVLLSNGADPNIKDREGDAALIVSARGGDYETVKVLLDNGADPNIEMDPDYECGTTPLMAAVSSKHHHVVELLLTKGADPNRMDYKLDIPLIVSARRGDHETVKVLLDNGADPNIGQEWEYLAPLIEAAREGHINVVELLLSKGADPNYIDDVSISTCT